MSKLGIRQSAQRDVGLLLSSFIVLAIAPLLIHVPHVCVLQKLFHLPCPGCGILHSLASIQHLHFQQSWQINPAGTMLALMLAFQVFGRALAIASTNTRPAINKLSKLWSAVVLASLTTVWILKLFHGGSHLGTGFLS